MLEKIEWKSLRMKLAIGAKVAEKEITLEKGKRIVTAVVTNVVPVQLVNLGLYENGNEISAPMNLEFWKRSNSGLYLDGFKPIEFRGGSQISVRIASTVAITDTNLEIEIVFGIIKEDTTC